MNRLKMKDLFNKGKLLYVKKIIIEVLNLFYLIILRIRGIHFLFFQECELDELSDYSDYEKEVYSLTKAGKFPEILSDDWEERNNEEKFPGWMDRLRIIYGEKFSEEYINCLWEMRKTKVFSWKGFPYRVGHSDYLNFRNGHRLVVNQPNIFKKKVLILGRSTVFGARMEDADTLPSRLQEFFNKTNKRILVDEYSIGGASVRMLLRYCIYMAKLKKEDIVALYHVNNKIVSWYAKKTKTFYCLKEIFYSNRRDILGGGECFFDFEHYNALASKRIAEITGNIILDYIDEKYNGGERNIIDEIPVDRKISKILTQYKKLAGYRKDNERIGAIVMNCNPFTRGHEYLIDTALSQVDFLYIFIVEENQSVFSFKERFQLVRDYCKNKKRICVLGSSFVISSDTFPEYFNKDDLQNAEIDPSLDLDLFARVVAPVLNISVRFVGEEPKDSVTRKYNEFMHRILDANGINVIEIPRLETNGEIISASVVRHMWKEGRLEEVRDYISNETYNYLKSKR